ncbi:MAG: SsrA-binding protein SmpB [Clostridiales bacterium]|nr:SsrA-binding protein SmpB [Clostridiales bacterium]
MGNKGSDVLKVVSSNKKAYHDYFIEEKYEAGIVLVGTEVKSVKLGNVNLKDSYAYVKDSEVFLKGVHIAPYEKGNIFNREPVRDRKLLLHKREIRKLISYVKQDGLSLVPLSFYVNMRGDVKVELAVVKGKKLYDKRDAIAKKDEQRNADRYVAQNIR